VGSGDGRHGLGMYMGRCLPITLGLVGSGDFRPPALAHFDTTETLVGL